MTEYFIVKSNIQRAYSSLMINFFVIFYWSRLLNKTQRNTRMGVTHNLVFFFDIACVQQNKSSLLKTATESSCV